ncbi:unnamed protein product, partial [Polarella glacialis]
DSSTAMLATAAAIGPMLSQQQLQGRAVREAQLLRRLATGSGEVLEAAAVAAAAASLAEAGKAPAAVALLDRSFSKSNHFVSLAASTWTACGMGQSPSRMAPRSLTDSQHGIQCR